MTTTDTARCPWCHRAVATEGGQPPEREAFCLPTNCEAWVVETVLSGKSGCADCDSNPMAVECECGVCQLFANHVGGDVEQYCRFVCLHCGMRTS